MHIRSILIFGQWVKARSLSFADDKLCAQECGSIKEVQRYGEYDHYGVENAE
jgi:hypothetical protein